ncbi:MAG: hypothetical protein JOZ69_22685, partial [Myxococcales bacterium]|nr:hypothetical protein [Myxococcales bacterium]
GAPVTASSTPDAGAGAAMDTGTGADSNTGSDSTVPAEGGGGADAGNRPDGDAAGSDGARGPEASADAPAPVCGPFAEGGAPPADAGPTSSMMSFFVSSEKNMTGDLGGLAGADMRCQTLAAAVGLGSKTWHAYLSVEHDPANANGPTHARDRIGAGPWYNAQGVLLAMNLTDLHARKGDPAVFLDEHGNMINGQWTQSLSPLEHDILTGTNADGTLAPGKTCLDWTSAMPADAGVPDGGELFVARVGHTDGFGPNCSTATTPNNVTSWNSAHDNAGCDNTAPRGGAGRIYCFAVP